MESLKAAAQKSHIKSFFVEYLQETISETTNIKKVTMINFL